MKAKFSIMRYGLAVGASLLMAGCATQTPEEQKMVVSMQADIATLQEEVSSLRGRVDAVEMNQDKYAGDIKRLSGETRESMDAARRRIDGMERSVAAVDAAREQDKKEVVSKLSDKIVEVVDRQRPVVVSGGDYVVQAGDTLSKIASRFGVRSDDLARANGLNDRNVIKVGQKLVIPK